MLGLCLLFLGFCLFSLGFGLLGLGFCLLHLHFPVVFEGSLRRNAVPELVVEKHLLVGESGTLYNLKSLVHLSIRQQLGRSLARVLINLCQEAQPEHLHLTLRKRLSLEFRQFHKDEVQTVYHFVSELVVNQMIIVVVVLNIAHKDVVHEVQRIYWLQVGVEHSLVRLRHIGFRGVQQHALLERLGPRHLHLDDELAPFVVATAHIDDAVLLDLRPVGNLVGRPVFYALNTLVVVQRQQRVEQALHQMLVLAEYLLESQVGFRVQVFSFYHIVSSLSSSVPLRAFACKDSLYFRDRQTLARFFTGEVPSRRLRHERSGQAIAHYQCYSNQRHCYSHHLECHVLFC